MRKLFLALLLPFLLPVSTQALQFGDAYWLTNTRYGTVPGEARLASNGDDVFLFWISAGSVRVTKLVDGVKRVGRPVLSTSGTSIDDFDVVWNGSNFVVAATKDYNIIGRLVDRTGEPIAGEFMVNGNAFAPRLAFNGSTILLLHRGVGFSGVGSLPLTKNGVAAGYGGQAVQLIGESFAVASNGTGFMAISASFLNVQLVHFNANGVISGTSELAGSANAGSREVAIATNGSRYFASWLEDRAGGFATTADDSGAAMRIRFAEQTDATYAAPSAVWSGSDYVLAYLRNDSSGAALQTVHFDAQAAPTTTDPEQPAADASKATAMLHKSGRVLIAWNRDEDAVVGELPVAAPSDAWSTFGAAAQTLLATATSADATLVVWSERVNGASSVRVGVREHDGDWSERLLANTDVVHAVAASDGTNFLIVTTGADRASVAYRVDARGVVFGRATQIPFEATGVAWNTSRYGIIGERASQTQEWNNDVVAATLSATGALSPVTLIRAADETGTSDEPAIASEGSNFLAVWLATDNPFCPFPCIVSTGVEGARLGSDLARLDATDLSIAPRSAVTSPPAIAWNGSEYVVASDDYLTMNVAFVSPSGAVSRKILADSKTIVRAPQAKAIGSGRVVVAWSDRGTGFPGGAKYTPRHQFAFVHGNGTIEPAGAIADDASDRFALSADANRIFYVSNIAWADAPHHGASRVAMRVAHHWAAGLPAPVPPPVQEVTAHLEDGRMVVEWSGGGAGAAPSGYRIEYRVGDGAWNEVAAWYGWQTFRASLVMPDNTAFRVRAFGEGGASLPSAPTPALRLPTPKRRAVR
jgi:hypothetical protein